MITRILIILGVLAVLVIAWLAISSLQGPPAPREGHPRPADIDNLKIN